MSRLGWMGSLLAIALLWSVAGPPRALAETGSAEASPVRDRLDTFTAAAEAQTAQAVMHGQQAWQRTKARLVAFKTRMRSKFETLGAALSDDSGSIATLNRDAASTLEAWRAVAAQSLAKMRAAAADTLERIAAWMRPPLATPAPT